MRRSNGHTTRIIGLAVVCLLSVLGGALRTDSSATQEDPQWVQSGFLGQRVERVLAHPATPGRVYTAFGRGTIFRSDDSGQAWSLLATLSGGGPPSMVIDPSDPNTLYACAGLMALKSVNGGASWGQLTISDISAWGIDPTDSSQVYAGGGFLDDFYRSTNSGSSWFQSRLASGAREIVVDAAGGAVFAAFVRGGTSEPDPGDGLYRSRDSGVSWTKIITSSFIRALAADPFDAQTLYLGTEGEGIFRSRDGGSTWAPLNSGLGSLAIHDLMIDPDDPRLLYAGTLGGGVFRSRDGGESWAPLNGGLSNPFVLSLALDPTGDGTLYAGTSGNGLYRITLLPPPPEATDTYVRVVGEDGRPVAGAAVWVNGTQAPGLSDSAGNLVLKGAQVGDQLVAMLARHEQPTTRQAHDGWAYRIYTASLGVQNDGGLLTTTVAHAPGRTELTIAPANTLVLFNLVVSIEWGADGAYLEQIRRAARAASDFMYDFSDGQMAFGQVSIYTAGAHWTDADVQIASNNVVRPHAFVGGIVSSDKAHVIRIGRGWDGRSGNAGPWDAPDGYRTFAHEFGHYGLFLYDEYFGYRFDASGNLAGERATMCTGQSNRTPSGFATNASVMDYQYASSELSMRDLPGLWSELCTITAQFQLNGESAWETVARRYVDPSALSRWRIRMPAERGGVVAGPPELPDGLLNLPEVHIVGQGVARPPIALTVLNPDGTGHRGAIVALYKRGGKVLGQGFTDSAGRLAIYGADDGDTLRAATFDAGQAGRAEVGATATLELQLRPVGGAALMADGPLPHLRLIPMPTTAAGQTELLILLQSFAADSEPTVLVTAPGSDTSQSPELSYSPVQAAYEGRVSFSAAARGTGRLRADRRAGPDRPVMQTSYRLQLVDNGTPWEVFSNDGNLRLNGGPGSLPGSESTLIVMPSGSVPGAPPAGHLIIGEAYDLTASGAVVSLEKPVVLTMHYDATLVNRVTPAGLSIFYWRPGEQRWEPVPSRVDEAQRTVVAQIEALGIYALFAPAGPWTEAEGKEVWLPLMTR
jgi:photosystem II stability/assembly factor-like uncharacterized protein